MAEEGEGGRRGIYGERERERCRGKIWGGEGEVSGRVEESKGE